MDYPVVLLYGSWYILKDAAGKHYGIDPGLEIHISPDTQKILDLISGKWEIGRMTVRGIFSPTIYRKNTKVSLEQIESDHLRFGKDYDIAIFFENEDDANYFQTYMSTASNV